MSPKNATWFAFLAALLVPVVAMAQPVAPSPAQFDPSQTDMTRWIIASIFGDWKGATEVPVIGGAMKVLNTFALMFGTLMFSYVAVVGALNSAQDGQVLGKKWSSMWIPLRFTVGTALLVPTASGFSTIQHFILAMALVGGGGGSQVWSAAVDGIGGSQGGAIVQSPDQAAKHQQLAKQIFKAEICNAALGHDASAAGIPAQFDIASNSFSAPTYFHKLSWGDRGGQSGYSGTACGTITTGKVAGANVDAGVIELNQRVGREGTSAGSVADSNASAAVSNAEKRLVDAQKTGILVAAQTMRDVATRLAKGENITSVQIKQAIEAGAAAYKTQILGASTTLTSAATAKYSAFAEKSKEAGWLMAGSTFFQMATIRSQAAGALYMVPAFSEDAMADRGVTTGASSAATLQDMQAMLDHVDGTHKGDADSLWNPGEWMAGVLGRAFSVNPSSTDHALVQIKDTGDRVILATEVAAGTYMAANMLASTASDTAGAVPVAGGLLKAVVGVAKHAFEVTLPAVYIGFISLFGVGITMAYIIPMMPFTMTIGSILGWLMAIFSAVVAAPIWIAGHLHPEGGDVAGKGVGGYMILLETVTRPIFIVLGLIGAFLIMDPMVKLVALLFRATMSSVENNTVTGVVGTITLAILYVTITLTTVKNSMTMAYVLSEKVYTWIGGAHAGMEQAREFHGSTQGAVGQGAAGLQKAGAASSAYAIKSARDRAANGAPPKAGPAGSQADDGDKLNA